MKRLQALEKKFKSNPAFQAEYEKEMNGFIESGHMILLKDDPGDSYYLAHHAVIKESSETTKCRIVNDASMKTSTGISLDDALYAGPTIQENLTQQLLRFRTHPFVVTADIEKMYRQILVHPDDRKFQKVLWWHKAIRTLHQLAKDKGLDFPLAAKLLCRDFYVDDFLSGANTLEEIRAIRDKMIGLLGRGGLVIRKWSSNHPSFLESIDKKIFDLDCGIQGNPIQKTLGIVWNSQLDNFLYSVNTSGSESASTKRKFLLQIAKIFDPLGKVTIRLACSKSRVVTLSHHTIPRLELASAALLSKLYTESKSQLDFTIDRVCLWSDSMIVLCWLKKAPHLLRTYESNRVAEIQKLEDEVQWRQVRSKDNPADSLSKGQLPNDFIQNSLWTSDPQWLSLSERNWPQSPQSQPADIPGFKDGIVLFTALSGSTIYSRFSDYGTLIRSVAYLLRWKQKEPPSEESKETDRSRQGVRYLSISEIALLHSTSKKTNYNPSSFRSRTKFDKLNLFLDDKGLLRVGGPLKKSDLLFNQKHPILLPSKHHLSDLIIRDAHQRNLHGGIQSTLYHIRYRFWILNGKNQVRHILHKCVICIRQKPKMAHAKMADLPESRVVPSSVFNHTGVDFFGPILIKEKEDRNRSFLKAYDCVFVCMATKAVHIELASDLSTVGFLACFRRFISIRGKPVKMYSDNGTNFVGANNELQQIYELHRTLEFKDAIRGFAESERIEWNFNPPLSPHFGGLWEAVVKSFKNHLNRIITNQKLTFEQMDTLLKEIAAILNSRPLYAISTDPNDPLAVTPAHILIGRPFNFLPENDFVSVPDNRLTTYQFITKVRQDFWKRWHKEYLYELQVRQKWLHSNIELKPGLVVVLLEDNPSCVRWPLGVVEEVHPGSNGIARVARVKIASGTYKRNITRMCVLPVAQEVESLPESQDHPTGN
ncbi:uncharacterized protein LOC131663025 [Phymastichus coffea]|uniref:uncharacterized protein LOC131663025 n=1 Tax=Phymastichus coffea TaxID=108790 RepID=UPI00273C063E|nr:uncharacterized protein LOC131663025 [Phymastichus coffea]